MERQTPPRPLSISHQQLLTLSKLSKNGHNVNQPWTSRLDTSKGMGDLLFYSFHHTSLSLFRSELPTYVFEGEKPAPQKRKKRPTESSPDASTKKQKVDQDN